MSRIVAVIGFVALLGACSSSSKATSSSPASTSTTTTTTVASGAASIGHVFVINLENEDYENTWGTNSPAHYLNTTLVPKGKLLTQYFAIGHFSLDNYIAEISGQPPNAVTQAACTQYVEFKASGVGAHAQALGSGCVYP